VIFFVVEGLIVWSVLRYRASRVTTSLPPQTHGNNLAEVTWTLIPTIIVIVLFFFSWQTLNSVEATSAQPNLKVRAVAASSSGVRLPARRRAVRHEGALHDHRADRPDGGLYLPAGQTTTSSCESPDVIHAFYVPQFLFKRDVVPGLTNQFDLEIPGLRRRPDLPRPVRRAVRDRPPDHAVRRPRPGPGRLPGLVTKASRPPTRRRRPRRRERRPGRRSTSSRRASSSTSRTLTVPAAGFTLHFDNQDTRSRTTS
jgi:hypothetical protein